MKRLPIFIALFLVSLPSQFTYACDICGCGLGNYYIGIVPQFNRAFIGTRYQYRYYQTHIAGDKTQFSNDYFQTVELWGGLNMGKRWQALVFVPFSVNRQVSDDGIRHTHGLGDIATILNYSLIEKTSLSRNNQLVYQQLLLGAGIKLPTGKNTVDINAPDIIALANTQTGSGSTDFLLNGAYTIRVNNLGFSSNLTYKINTMNRNAYQFGNKLSSNNFLFYIMKGSVVSVVPNVGLLYERSHPNKLNELIVQQTGGYALMGCAGIELNFKRISCGLNIQAPLDQDYAFGQTKTKLRGMAHLSLGF